MAIIYQNYRILLFAILLQVACCAGCNAQTSSELTGTKWVLEELMKKNILEFTKDSVIETVYYYHDNSKLSYSKPYYLFITKTGPFDFEKVGKKTSGKFLLCWNDVLHGKEYCEITKLTDDTLVLFFEARSNHIGSEDTYVTYKKVK